VKYQRRMQPTTEPSIPTSKKNHSTSNRAQRGAPA
jgi:hypothetical protein